jgi:hypothetical protein
MSAELYYFSLLKVVIRNLFRNLRRVILLDFVSSAVIFQANDRSTHVRTSFLQENVMFMEIQAISKSRTEPSVHKESSHHE